MSIGCLIKLSERIDHGYVKVDSTGNTNLVVNFFYYDFTSESLVDSSGNPHFEAPRWGHADFYIEYNGRKIDWQSENKIILMPPIIPRYAEVVDGTLYILAGQWNFPYSENFEETALNRMRDLGVDIKSVGNWEIFEFELPNSNTSWDSAGGKFTDDSPLGVRGWSYYDLQSDSLAQSIINPSVSYADPSTSSAANDSPISLPSFSYQQSISTADLENAIQVGRVPASRIVVGTAYADTIIGSSAAELIAGGPGIDRITGGTGPDAFSFDSPDQFGKKHADVITDFIKEEGDIITISRDSFDGLKRIKFKSVRGKQKAMKASASNKNLIYDNDKGILYFNENGKKNGWGDGGEFVKLLGAPELGNGDLAIV